MREDAAKTWLNVLYGQRTLALLQEVEKTAAENFIAVKAAHRGALLPSLAEPNNAIREGAVLRGRLKSMMAAVMRSLIGPDSFLNF